MHGSVASAAGALHLSPSAVCQQLLDLERAGRFRAVDARITALVRLLSAEDGQADVPPGEV